MKNFLAVALICIVTTSFGQEKNFTLSGNIQHLDTRYIRVFLKDSTQPRGYFIDSIPVKDSSTFTYQMHIGKMEYLTLMPGVDRTVKRTKDGRGYYPAKSSMLQFIATPGGKVHFTGKITDYVDAYPSGDDANADLAFLNRQLNPMLNKSVNLMVAISDRKDTSEPEVRKINAEIEALDKQADSIKLAFVNSHPSSVAGAWALGDMMVRSQISNEEAINLFKKMDKEKLVGTPFYNEVAQRVDGLLATAIGKESPELVSTNTYDRKKFDLKTLRGKYVILDFWGTWCMPCISGMPKMKEYHDKYRNRMEIVGIAQESDDGTNWRTFLDKNKDYHWHQILNRPENDLILKFSVAGFPTKIILDPNGRIVGRFVGEDEAIYNKLDELLK
ncbi:MAG: redoxin domain-containing protein [Chitinophagaceae bacterium]|nr:redoxin domain-containing protein [Chitinophagaceae bacterium]MCW5913099.1 redoxin domain-containing protein [Chitinophagaceae bacterium]MCZ2396896.1 TlpA family protein disulfide reductase [Chitinophagales bacterium]